jgi:hypothetical protein
LLLPDQLFILASANRAYGQVDMIFTSELDSKRRRAVEDLVLKWYNQAIEWPVARTLDWVPRPQKRKDMTFEFEEGWNTKDRFETISLELASILTAGGDMRPLLHFLVDVDLIARLSQVWVAVEAPVEWVSDWYYDEGAPFGHYSSPVHVLFKRVPTEKQRRRIEGAVKRIMGREVGGMDSFWEPANKLTLGVFSVPDDAVSENLLDLLEHLEKIAAIEVVGIGVVASV